MTEDTRPKSLYQYDLEGLQARIVELGGQKFHAKVLRKQVLEKGLLDVDSLTSLPAALREALPKELPLLAGQEIDQVGSKDGTIKFLTEFERADEGRVAIETVFMPTLRKNSERGATVCVSTQAGCPVGCTFCASGLGGLIRNLGAHEIVEQFVRARALGPIGRCVVMGIGEPLLNFGALQEALATVREGLDIGARKITVSTVGFPDRLRKAADENPRFDLAISLHTPFQEQRDALVPAMAGVPIEDVLAAGDYWFEKTGREVTYEYVLLGEDTDTPDHAQALAECLQGRRATINLIPYNPSRDLPYQRPRTEAVEGFQRYLQDAGLVAPIRWSRGLQESAACGQLRALSQ